MARNVINLENVAGYAQYGNDYTNIIEEQRKKKKKQQEKEDSWTDFSAFEDGYQFGDVSKAILGTGVKTAQNFTKGAQSNLEGLLDFGTNVASMGTEALGFDNATKKLRNFAQKDFIAENDLVNKTLINTNPMLALLNQGIGAYENLKNGYDPGDLLVKNNQIATLLKGQGTLSKGIDKIASNSITGNKLDSLAQTVGQISGQAALGSTGIPWQLTAFANSAGGEMNNAFQNNATAGQAFISGLISGAVEVGTEYIGGGANKLLGMESLGSKGLAKLGSKISNKVVNRLLKVGIDASSEGLEEVLSGLGTAIGQKLTYMNDKELEELYSKDQALDDFVMGALGTVITNVPGQVQSIKRGENALSGLTENEQTVLDKVIEQRTNEAQKDGKELTKKQLNEIEDQAREDLQNGYISADTIEETLGDNYNADKDVMLRESFNERTRRRTNFNTDLNQYKDENQRKIVQKAIDSGILNDSKKTHNFVDLVSKIAADKGMDFDFTNNERIKESGFGVEGKTVNGYVNGNTIGLNIESNNALNKTVGHEITHVLEGSDMYQALQDTLRSYVGEGEWQSRLKSLSETYKNVENADVTKELTADLVGENLFNNENFVRSLSTKDRNLFEKIYDEIKYLVKVATAGSKEKRDLVKLQKVFQEAYRDSKTTKEGTQYSLTNSNYIQEQTGSEKGDAYSKFFMEKTTDFDKNQKQTTDGTSRVLRLQKGDNEAKLSITENDNEIWIDELYIKNQKQGYGKEIVDALKQYAYDNGKTIRTYKEVGNAREFWDKMFGEENRDGGFSHKYENHKPEYWQKRIGWVQERIDRFTQWRENAQRENKLDQVKYLDEQLQKDREELKQYQDELNKNQDVKYSLTDSQGRELSKEQQEYFKDSKIRNDNGELEVVYHTTPNQFTVFDSERAGENTGYDNTAFGSFVTTNRNFSERFGDINEEGTKGNTMEMYANITNPITHPYNAEYKYSGEQLDNIVENWFNAIGETEALEELKSYVEDGEYDSLYQAYRNTVEFSDESPFEYASDERERLQEKGYDGVEFVEGLDKDVNYNVSDSNEPVSSYAVFNSNQVKNVDNTNPTSNPDIRYSLSPSGEMVDNTTGEKVTLEASEEGNSGTLMVLHNLGESKVNGILDLDGIPVPSIAVTNPNIIDHNQFGEGTLIFDKETINPANRLNEVYDRDIWSPTFPQIDYNIKSEDLWKIEKNIYNDYKDDIVSTGLNRFFDTDNLDSKIKTMGIEGTIEDAKQSPELMYIFEKTVNPNYQAVIKSKQFNNKYSNEMLQNFIDNYNRNEPLNEVRIDDDIRKQFKEAVQPYYDAEMENFLAKLKPEQRESGRKLMQETYEADMEKNQNINDFLISAYRLQNEGMDAQTVDKYATLDKIKNDVNKVEFEKWVDDTLGNLLRNAEKGIYNGKDYITNNGRRTFKQLHNPYNLENLVKALTKGNTKGTQQTIANGFGKIQAQMGNQFKSIADIKGAESQLMSAAEANQTLEVLEENINQDISDLADRLDGDFWNMDNASNLIQEFASKKNRNENIFRKLLEDYANHGVSSELINRIANDLDSLSNIPTDYFEAKPQRAVGLDEIQMAVIPNNWSAETKQRLTDKGIKYTEYDPSIEGDRQRVINQFDDLKFSLSQQNDIAPTRGWDVRGRDIALESAIAPLQEQVQQLQSTLEEVKNNIAPTNENIPAINEQEASQLGSRFNENDIAPIRANLTEQESKRLDFLDNLERENMLNDNLAEERNELMAKEKNAPEYGEDMTPVESLNDVRDMDEVARDRSANAYQYEHPEVKPYFQEEARVLLAEINEVIPGERYMIPGKDYLHPTEWGGNKRFASEDVANLLDGYTLGTKYTKDQLREGLNAIIEDHGLENKAVSKRLEFMLDDRLRNGYETIEGYQIEPNQDYLNMLKEQSWDKYYDEAPIEEAPNDIRYSAEDEFDLAPFEPQDRDVMEMVDNEGYRKSTTQNRPPISNKQKSGLRQAVDAIKSGIVNRNVEIDNLSRDSGNRNIKFYGDMMNSAMGEVSYDIGTAQTNNKGETVGKSIKSLFEKAKRQGLGAAFNDFLINYSNIDRHAQNKGSKIPLEVSKRLVRDYAIKYPEFKQWAKDVWTYGKNARQNLVDAGLIDQQLADYLGEIYPHYVPYVSDYENADRYFEGVGELIPKGLKRAKGNAGKLLSVEDALSKYTYAQKMAIRQNELYKEIVHTLGQIPNFGVDERTDYTDMRDSLYTDSRGNYLTAYENGKQITTQVSKDLFKELSRTTENQLKDVENKLSLITKPLQGVSKLRKSLITTWNPTFPVTNAIKDLQDALFNSKHTKDMVKNYLGAVKELATGKGKEVNQFLALYGSGLTMGEYSSDGLNKLSEKIPLINTIKQINEVVELAPRYAEFKASLQNGESLQEAIYNAREVTTNFNRGGTIAKAMNRNGFTFLNASIQGFDKFIRNFSGQNGAKGIVQAMAKVAALGIAPALFNHLAYDDDEEYEGLKDYIKDNYYLIKTDEGKFIRIPKGRMLSIFGSAARRALDSSRGNEEAFNGYLENAWNQIGINDPGENNVFAPFIQAFGSKNGTAWYGGDIVPSRLQKENTENQYDENTDKFSIWLGDKIGVSPKKINYVLDQYLGGIGDVLLPMGTEAASSDAESVGEYLTAPWKDKFSASSVDDSKYPSEFYSTRDSIPSGVSATDEEKLQKKYLDYISYQMTDLYAKKREVQSDPELSKKEKYRQATEIKEQINELAKQGLEDYKNVDISGNYATINGIKYKKGSDGKWTKQRK